VAGPGALIEGSPVVRSEVGSFQTSSITLSVFVFSPLALIVLLPEFWELVSGLFWFSDGFFNV
jgi:hypothetical protein